MTIALTHPLADVVSSAAATGREVAGNLLHEASQAAEHAAGATSATARRLLRSAGTVGRPKSSHRASRALLGLLTVVAAVWAAAALRSRFGAAAKGVRSDRGDATPAPLADERNGTVTSHRTDEVKGRVKEAAGALTGNDDLKSKGKSDQAAASAKQAVDKARDKVSQGIDAVKDTINKH